MSKRLCTSLLHAPQRSQASLPRCSIHSTFCIRRDDLHHRQFPSTRPFTSSTRCTSGPSAIRGMQGRKQSQPSMAVQMKEKQKSAQRDGSMLEHLGFLPDTFVSPTGKNLPSWFTSPKDRWKVQKLKLWNTFYYLASHYMAWWMVTPRVKLERRKLPELSKKLYEEMYTHFAAGNLQAIEPILSAGMLGSLRSRIGQRTPNTGLQWTLHRYLSHPRVVSYRFQILPDGAKTEKNAFAQAVVQIRSLQSLCKTRRLRVINNETRRGYIKEAVFDEQGNMIQDKDVEAHKRKIAKVTTEYLVVQRFVKLSRPGEWHVWGTVPETRMEDIRGKERENERELMSKV